MAGIIMIMNILTNYKLVGVLCGIPVPGLIGNPFPHVARTMRWIPSFSVSDEGRALTKCIWSFFLRHDEAPFDEDDIFFHPRKEQPTLLQTHVRV